MRPRRTVTSSQVFRLEGGTEDNDLWVTLYGPEDDTADAPCIGSTWVPTEKEREEIAAGANIELVVFGTGHPPVTMRLSTYALGKKPNADA
jgi:hypothetical protein